MKRGLELDPSPPYQKSETRLSGPEIAPIATFGLPYPLDWIAVLSAWLFGKPIYDLSAGRDDCGRGAGFEQLPAKINSVSAKPVHHGDAGWEDR